MPSIGPLEILVVAVIALLVFGPEKLPEIARQVGRAASELRRMANEVRDEFDTGFEEDDAVDTPRPVTDLTERRFDTDEPGAERPETTEPGPEQ